MEWEPAGAPIPLDQLQGSATPQWEPAGEPIPLSQLQGTPAPLQPKDTLASMVNAPTELSDFLQEHAPTLGAMVGGVVPATLPLRAVASGTGSAIGGLLRHGGGEPDPQEQALMDLGLPMVTGQTLQDFAVGAGGEAAGTGVAKVAGKIMAPAAGKISEGARTFMDWAKKNNLPFSPDIVTETLPAQAARMSSEYTGIGNLFVNRARKKLEKGAIEISDNMVADMGLPVGVQQATAGAETATKVREFGRDIYGGWNEALSGLSPGGAKGREILLDDTMQYLGDRVEGEYGQKSIQYGIDSLAKDVFPGARKNKPLIAMLRKVDENGGTLGSGKDVAKLFDALKDARNQADPYGKKIIDTLKQTVLDDLERVEIAGQNTSLGALRRSADAAWKDMVESPLIKKFMNADVPKRGQPFIRSDRLAYETFLESNSDDAIKLKAFLIDNGFKDQWDALNAAYLEKVFSNSVKDGMFKPENYLSWFKKHGENAKHVMPEYAGALDEWNTVSGYLAKELGRKSSNATAGNVLTGGSNFVGYAAGGVPGVVAANGFSLLAALSTMGKGNLGFLGNYLLKETPGAAGSVMQQGMGQAVKMGTIEELNREFAL